MPPSSTHNACVSICPVSLLLCLSACCICCCSPDRRGSSSPCPFRMNGQISHKNIWMFRWPNKDKTKQSRRQSVSPEIRRQQRRENSAGGSRQKNVRPPRGGLTATVMNRWLNALPARVLSAWSSRKPGPAGAVPSRSAPTEPGSEDDPVDAAPRHRDSRGPWWQHGRK